jgi:hypothetical protein
VHDRFCRLAPDGESLGDLARAIGAEERPIALGHAASAEDLGGQAPAVVLPPVAVGENRLETRVDGQGLAMR